VRRINLDHIQAGATLAKSIITLEGTILLSAGTELNEEHIKRLQLYGITEIFIEDDISRNIHVQELIREEIVLEAKQLVKETMVNTSITTSIDGKKLMEIVDKLIEGILANEDIIATLCDIRSLDDYTFSHSVNVCIYSLVIGIGMGYVGDSLRELGIGSMLHDIGKVKIPQHILQKPGRLTVDEFDEIKKHTIYGSVILKDAHGINMTASLIALSHHERSDGSGYPHHLKNDNIYKAARIVAVSDVYDALTTDRVYRNKLMHHEVADYITSLASHHFDQKVVDTFIRYVAYYPVGTAIILNNGEKGLVSKYNKYFPTRPVVRIVMDEEGKMLPKHKEVDLNERLEYRIVKVWDI